MNFKKVTIIIAISLIPLMIYGLYYNYMQISYIQESIHQDRSKEENIMFGDIIMGEHYSENIACRNHFYRTEDGMLNCELWGYSISLGKSLDLPMWIRMQYDLRDRLSFVFAKYYSPDKDVFERNVIELKEKYGRSFHGIHDRYTANLDSDIGRINVLFQYTHLLGSTYSIPQKFRMFHSDSTKNLPVTIFRVSAD